MSAQEMPPAATRARRKKRRPALIMAALLVLGLTWSFYRMATYNPNYVTEVFRADTLTLKSGDGVLLIGVDCDPPQHEQVGRPAAEFTREYVLHRYIRIELDKQQKNDNNWTLGYVFPISARDGKEIFLNEELLRRGLARLRLVYPNFKYRERLEAAEAEAKRLKLGVWAPDYVPPGG